MRDVFSHLSAERSPERACGLCSVCSSHPLVIEAAVRFAGRTGKPLLVEATANQVNQHGGYTGLVPETFVAMVDRLRRENAVDPSLVVVGGDHLGPYPWRAEPEEPAMREAQVLVRQFVHAGARKIHLDASMALAGESAAVLQSGSAVARAVSLCRTAEEESRLHRGVPPVYVIGTEVPVPGGEAVARSKAAAPVVTRPDDVVETILLHRRLFHEAGLDDAWTRVIAVVVQPGIDFDALTVYPYRRDLAAPLVGVLADFPGLVFEAHSTDYQSTSALRALVEDGFAILKVGPELTFTLREGLFGLSAIEDELLRGSKDRSNLRAVVLETMREKPGSWRGYYTEGEALPFLMTYGYSDRMRYYWDHSDVARATRNLFANLGRSEIPLPLISQFLPHLPHVSDLPPARRSPKELLLAMIEAPLERYARACTEAVQ